MRQAEHMSRRPKYRTRKWDVRNIPDDVFLKYRDYKELYGMSDSEALNSMMSTVMRKKPRLRLRGRNDPVGRAESKLTGYRVCEGLLLNFRGFCAVREWSPPRAIEAAILWHIAEEIPFEICGTADDVSRPVV